MEELQNSESYLFHFGCKENEVDSKTLIASLSSFTEIIEEVNKELHTGKGIEIKIKPFEAGSFDIPFDLVEVTLAGVLAEHAFSIPDIIKIYIELIKLKLNFKSSSPEERQEIDAGIEIKENNGNITIVDNRTINIYKNNEKVNHAVERQFERLDEDRSIDEIELWSKENKPLMSVPRNEFKNLTSRQNQDIMPIDVVEIEDSKPPTVEKASLNIFKVVFDSNHKWEFFYKGNKIAARIKDTDFINKSLSGERFANGDVLEVDLRINRVFDKVSNTFVNKSYEIIEVHKHIPREDQLTFLK